MSDKGSDIGSLLRQWRCRKNGPRTSVRRKSPKECGFPTRSLKLEILPWLLRFQRAATTGSVSIRLTSEFVVKSGKPVIVLVSGTDETGVFRILRTKPARFKMDADKIAEVAIDREGRMLIFPVSSTYSMIYREAVEVHWDSEGRFLYSPKPREWSYFHWFKHIINVAGGLSLTSATKWTNVPEDLRHEAEAWMSRPH